MKQLEEKDMAAYLDSLPDGMRKTATRYKRWQDVQACLFGKLLLREGLKLLIGDSWGLHRIQYSQYNKPYIANARDIDFNISHSGKFVLCAIAYRMKLGVDVEEIKPIVMEDFYSQFTSAEWKNIQTSENSDREFFKYWTIKEAVIKADGRGLHIPLKDIFIGNGVSVNDNKCWHIQEINLSPDYSAHLATEELSEFKVVEMQF